MYLYQRLVLLNSEHPPGSCTHTHRQQDPRSYHLDTWQYQCTCIHIHLGHESGNFQYLKLLDIYKNIINELNIVVSMQFGILQAHFDPN